MQEPLARHAGILCHPTSVPSPFGIGDLGAGSHELVDWISRAGLGIWQILPLGPTGYGDSPYQPFSAFAGNPLLIDPLDLREAGLLTELECAEAMTQDSGAVDYGRAIEVKHHLLREAFSRFGERDRPDDVSAHEAFRARNRHWLDDYCLFMALKAHFAWESWTSWDRDIALRQGTAVDEWRARLADEVAYHAFAQFVFHRQWSAVRAHAEERGVRILGDIPLYVGHDSADVWSHQELFRLDADAQPTVVAGVPPDYFSATGQRWGNPHYRWDLMAQDGYQWWMRRLERTLEFVHLVRLDHFRGFAGYWEIPASQETAVVGRWVKGPGASFFECAEQRLGGLPVIAEDLGTISPDVHALRETFGLPGMRVLQFGFDGDASSPHLPHNHPTDNLVYTGTHDNDTSVGWYASRDESSRHRFRAYAGSDGQGVHWAFIRMAMASVSQMAVFPLQDILGLGSEARLNTPGDPHGNWTWRFDRQDLTDGLAHALRELAVVTGRLNTPGDVEARTVTDDDSDIIEYEASYTDAELAAIARRGEGAGA